MSPKRSDGSGDDVAPVFIAGNVPGGAKSIRPADRSEFLGIAGDEREARAALFEYARACRANSLGSSCD